jgi:redox-sensitive bicupin YhaK (pirin superfamily)
LAGHVDHGDSLGNQGSLGAGDVQWMTAGSGIVHQEMPKGDAHGRMHGFQLWANLPSALKMTRPRYQDVKAADIPAVTDDDGTRVRVICGSFWGRRGPVDGVAADPRYLDVWVPAGVRKRLPVETSRNAFAYIFEGSGRFRDASEPREVETDRVGPVVGPAEAENLSPAEAGNPGPAKAGRHVRDKRDRAGRDSPDLENRTLVVFDRGDEVVIQAGEHGIRFLLVSGRPIEEPVAWYGPIVMNTEEELRQAYAELRAGTFIK